MRETIGLCMVLAGIVSLLYSYFCMLEKGYSAFHFFSYDRMTPLGKKLWRLSVVLIITGIALSI